MAWFDDLELPGATITGQFGYVTADGPDEDDNPDVMVAGGTVTFTATTPAARVDGSWLGIQSVTAQIFEGRIVVAEEDLRPIRLLATDANIGVADWAWKATFDIRGFMLAPLTFKAPRDTTVNLTADLIPIKSQPYQIIEGASIVDAEDDPDSNRVRFLMSDGTRTSWVDIPNGEKGAKGDQGSPGERGSDGQAATLSMGVVAAGSAADAWMTGTPLARELNLTLPRGERGLQGIQGDRGERGLTGEKGDKGDAGESGHVGIPIFPSLAEALAWEAANPGRSALTTEAPPDPGAWQAARPLFNQVGRSVTIPNDAGATYQIDGAAVSGTVLVTPPVTVTVVAVVRPGYVLAGDTEWSFDFVEVLSAYDAAAMNLDPQFYYRLDEGSAPWENRGSGSLELAGTSATQVAGIGGFAFSTSGEIRLRNTPPATAFSLAVIVKTDGSARMFNPWTPPLGIEMYRLPTETRARVLGPSQTSSDAFLPRRDWRAGGALRTHLGWHDHHRVP